MFSATEEAFHTSQGLEKLPTIHSQTSQATSPPPCLLPTFQANTTRHHINTNRRALAGNGNHTAHTDPDTDLPPCRASSLPVRHERHIHAHPAPAPGSPTTPPPALPPLLSST
nr:unnamed protein product [Digitaria exilis]